MSDIAIHVEGLSKQYFIGGPQKRYSRISDQVVDMATAPFRRAARLIGGHGSAAELNKQFWALKDIEFDINHGDVVGIIGHNGAGKSTLLKILSRITEPTRGYAEVFGRISSLLEVGTGFHPELTGRENIYLNGAILGMRKAEIDRKFDAIVDFAEIENFIDTPVKHYSSGMYVRLAFSVAAHLEPEILLVDEVLSVGDVAFQKKCLGKMDSVSRQGRTVIFVSHNMNAIQRLCPTSLLLSEGCLVAQGDTAGVIEHYLSSSSSQSTSPDEWIDLSKSEREGSGKVRFVGISYSSLNQATGFHPYSNGPLEISLEIISDSHRTVDSIAVTLYDRYGTKLINADTLSLGKAIPLKKGQNNLKIKIEKLYLNPGIYTLGLWVADPPSEVYDYLASAIMLEIIERESELTRVQEDGLVQCKFEVFQT
jgi:ABC-type polysaccharide/polyol phosphate transport system ATPase subunit